MLTIMIILMLLKLLYDGIGAFYSQAIVSAKNPYASVNRKGKKYPQQSDIQMN